MLECAELSNERSFLFIMVFSYWKTRSSKGHITSNAADTTLSGGWRQTTMALNWSDSSGEIYAACDQLV
jgi:hypothetical protein